jgi:predicted glycosyltransferase
MRRLMFYCQHILGIGHLVRSMEIVRGLTQEFEIFFINGGEEIQGFQIPPEVEVLNLPPIKTDSEFRALHVPPGFSDVEQVLEYRSKLLVDAVEDLKPDILMVELFPFGRRRFSTELIPFLETAKTVGTKVVCSLRDIVVTKQDQMRHEEKICRLMNQYFDMLLIHGDPKFMPLETSFSRIADLNCEVHYTGYVVQQDRQQKNTVHQSQSNILQSNISNSAPLILTSVGGGRFGHELLNCVAQVSTVLEHRIPHHIQMFTGPFCPDQVFEQLQTMAAERSNLSVERFTPNLLQYMQQADLSISMAGYNTTMNVLTTGVRSMLLPFMGNDDQEQRMRSERLAELGIVSIINREDLEPKRFAEKVLDNLKRTPTAIEFDLNGVEKTAQFIKSITLPSRSMSLTL